MGSLSILSTKLYAPPPRPQRVPRPRLIEQLNAGLQAGCQLILISAPAGFGKTTLLTDWLSDSPPVRSAWLSLDEDDNDLTRFFAYFVAALRRLQPDLGDEVLSALKNPRPPVEEIMPALINLIGAWSDRAVLILDDYHFITAAPIHAAAAYLIDHLPASLSVIIATRADPPLPLPRWRARNQLLELRQVDLRFTPDEAADFLARVMGLQLAADEVAVLAARTEGWIAGLQLAAVSLHGQPDAGRFIQSFAGSQRHILDYLVEEVLQRQPADIQTFLLHTSILDSLTGAVCDAVLDRTGSQSSARILEQLERDNLFVVPLDDRRESYRYHRLFADLLRHRLQQQLPPEHLVDLHRRASAWYAQHAQPLAAIDHALAAGEPEQAAELAAQAAPSIWQNGEFGTCQRVMDALPFAAVLSRPRLCIYHAAVLLLSGGTAQAKAATLLQAAADRADTDQLRGEVAMLRSTLAVLKNDIAAGIEEAEAALQLLPPDDWFYGLALRNLSVIYLLRGDAAKADRALAESIAASQHQGDRVGLSASLRRMGSLCLMRGRLRQARDFYQRAIDAGGTALRHAWPLAGRALMHLGELALEWNDLDAAEQYLSEAHTLLAATRPAWDINGLLVQAQLKQVQGDAAGVRQALAAARQLAAESDTTLDDVLVEARAARLALAQGDVATARRWADACRARASSIPGPSTPDFVGEVVQEIEQAVLARVCLATGQIDEALARLRPVLENAEKRGRYRAAIELLIVQARAFKAGGQPDRAGRALLRALTLAEPEGYLRAFIDEGDDIRSLLSDLMRTALVDPKLRTYGERLQAAFGQPDRPAAPGGSSLIEPLSERELDILRLIAAGLSNQDIAARLYLSLATVKWHAGHLYAKLGVQSRTQAVAKARELGLLPAA